MKRGCWPQGNPIGGCLYRMTTLDRFRACVCTCGRHSLTWVRHNKLSPETSLSLEVDHQTALLIYLHTSGVHGSYKNREQSLKVLLESTWAYIFLLWSVSTGREQHWSKNIPCSSASGGLPMPSCHRIAVSYTKVSLSSDCRSKCCQPPTATGEWKM